MEYEFYRVERDTKLKDLALQLNLTENMIRSLNPNMRTFNAFLSSTVYVPYNELIKIPLRKKKINHSLLADEEETSAVDFDFIESQKEHQSKEVEQRNLIQNLPFDQETRYRCEQTVVMKIGEIVKSHSETKREFVVKRKKTDNFLYYNIVLVDNIINFYPSSLENSLSLLSEIDKIKCNADIEVCPKTGKIKLIRNLPQIKEKWNEFKQSYFTDAENISDPKIRKNTFEFLRILDLQFSNQREFIIDLQTKLFFDLFFDKYLIDPNSFNNNYPMVLNSQLFNGIKLHLQMSSHILQETNDKIEVRKISELDKKNLQTEELVSRYNEQYRPIIGYKFSEFDFSYRTRITYNKEQNLIENADVSIIERVKNNVQLLIKYNLKRIEL